jgi:hypothetical protein
MSLVSIFKVDENCLAYSSTLKIDATCSSETSVAFQQTAYCFTSQMTERSLHNDCCKNLKSYLQNFAFNYKNEKCLPSTHTPDTLCLSNMNVFCPLGGGGGENDDDDDLTVWVKKIQIWILKNMQSVTVVFMDTETLCNITK